MEEKLIYVQLSQNFQKKLLSLTSPYRRIPNLEEGIIVILEDPEIEITDRVIMIRAVEIMREAIDSVAEVEAIEIIEEEIEMRKIGIIPKEGAVNMIAVKEMKARRKLIQKP